MAAELAVPLGIVLEGGYDLGALARSVSITLEAVGVQRAPVVPEVAPHPLAAQAQERLARGHWPALA
jgi:acetoin utilization deacetylase AcuC-like enzyme